MSKKVLSLEQFEEKVWERGQPFYGWPPLDGDSDMLPCYSNRFTVNGHINTKDLVIEYLKVARKHAFITNKARLSIFSVTKKDKYHKLWLEVAKELGLTVIETKSSHFGAYKCWMIIQKY